MVGGFHGFIVERACAFVRGSKEEETLSKAPHEAMSYLAWLGIELEQLPTARKVQTHLCKLMVEDADCEILIDVDRAPMGDREFQLLVELAKHSGLSIRKLYDSVKLKNWIDEARLRKTFNAHKAKTLKEMID